MSADKKPRPTAAELLGAIQAAGGGVDRSPRPGPIEPTEDLAPDPVPRSVTITETNGTYSHSISVPADLTPEEYALWWPFLQPYLTLSLEELQHGPTHHPST